MSAFLFLLASFAWEAVKLIAGLLWGLCKAAMYLALAPFLLIWHIIKAIF